MTKKLVFCADGTWNHPNSPALVSGQDTNVYKLYKSLAAGAAQTTAGYQQRQRLQQVCFAAAVRPVQHGDARRRAPDQRLVVAEIGQDEAIEAEHGAEHGVNAARGEGRIAHVAAIRN